ncbi:MAG: hypothetical protein AB7N91_20960 [Candidatus Tectimicrobiota bacterium]
MHSMESPHAAPPAPQAPASVTLRSCETVGTTLAMSTDQEAPESPAGGLQALMTLLAQTVHDKLGGVQDGLAQTHDLVHDAVVTLGESFHTLHAQICEQEQLMQGLSADALGHSPLAGQQGASLHSLFHDAAAFLHEFVELVMTTSKQSMQSVYKIDDMVQHLQGMHLFLDEARALAQQTQLVAMSVSMVVAQAGEAGQGVQALADAVRALALQAQHWSEHIGAQVELACTTMDDIRALTESMASKDMNAALLAKGCLDMMLHHLESTQQRMRARLEAVAQLTSSIGSNVGLAVQSLQFEDIVVQLVDYMRSQLNRQAHVFTALQANMEEAAQRESGPESGAGVTPGTLTSRVLQLRQEWDATEHKPVRQASMDSGDIELF